MKKIVLSIAAVMAAAAFAPEASAVPVFARQTGMACSACHFQHFPLLNGFGRAFKSAGFTMMGAQGKIEGEHGSLDIPANLNLGVLTTTGYETVSGSTANIRGGNKAWFVPASGGELSIFFGGRVSEFAGFLSELQPAGAAAGAAKTGAAKLALLFPVGDWRVGVVAHTSNGQGVAYSYEVLNTGAVNTHKMTALNGNNQGAVTGVTGPANAAAFNTANAAVAVAAANPALLGPTTPAAFNAANAALATANAALALAAAPVTTVVNNGGHTGVYSAAQYLGTATAATGLSFIATNPNMGYVNIGKYDMAGVGTATAGSLPLTYVRVAGLFDMAGWDMGAGIQSFSGTSQVGVNAQAKATVIDFQAQGEVAGMPMGIYTSYGTAPTVAGGTNAFNAGNIQKRTTFNIGAELGVIPHVATLQLAMRSAKSGGAVGFDGSNAIQVGATYELAQNVELSLTHTSQSGSEWNTAVGQVAVGKTMTSLMMEALF